MPLAANASNAVISLLLAGCFVAPPPPASHPVVPVAADEVSSAPLPPRGRRPAREPARGEAQRVPGGDGRPGYSGRPDPAGRPGRDADRPGAASRPARGGAWRELGAIVADGRRDHDSVKIRPGRGLRSLRLQVEDGAVRVHDLVIVFEDGTRFSPETRAVFAEGTTSRVIDLPGGRRQVRRVELWTSDERDAGRGRIAIWGR